MAIDPISADGNGTVVPGRASLKIRDSGDCDVHAALFDQSALAKAFMVYIGVDHWPAVCVMKLPSNLAEICLNASELVAVF